MDFLELAKQIEKQGMEQYSLMAKTLEVKGLNGIFAYMGEQEKRHYELFDSWQRKEPARPGLPEETVLGKAKEAFENLAKHFIPANFVAPGNYEQAYKQALQFENNSIDLYTKALSKVDDGQQPVLVSIIKEEMDHARFITDLMEFLRHPGEWLENAEWHHSEEY
jgi:rubrerythrin